MPTVSAPPSLVPRPPSRPFPGLFTSLLLIAAGPALTVHGSPPATAVSSAWEEVRNAPDLSDEERGGVEFLAQFLDLAHYQDLSAPLRRQLLHYAADHRDGTPALVLCWEPHTKGEIVSAFQAVEEAGAQVKREDKRPIGIGAAFQLDITDHWASTANNGSGQQVQGQPITLTWSIVPDGTNIPGGQVSGEATNDPSNLRAWLAGLYGGSATDPAADQPWFPLFETIFTDWAAKSGIRYVYEPNDDGVSGPTGLSSGNGGQLGVRGDLRISGHALDGNSNVLAYNYFPDYGDMVIDTSDNFYNTTTNNSLRLRNVLSHEHGHGVGLQHVCPVDNTKLMEPFINLGFEGLQFDDIYSAQRLYGDQLEVHGAERDNDTAAKATPVTTPVNTPLVVEWLGIDDNGDTDYFRFAATAGTQLTVRVVPSAPLYLEGEQNAATGNCTAGTSFDSSTVHDLSFDILDTDGSTILASGNTQPAGTAEVVAALPINTAGDYLVRVTGGGADSNQLYRLEIEVAAPAVALQVVSVVISKELFQGSNGVADPGETVEMQVQLQNLGLLSGTNIMGALVVPAPSQGFGLVNDFGTIASGGTATGSFVFAKDGSCGQLSALQLNLTADGGYAATLPIPLVLGLETTFFSEDFDASGSLPAGWGNTETGKGSLWSVVSSPVNSAPNAIFAADQRQAGQSLLTTPAIVLGASAGTLTFSHFYDTETNFDGGVLEINIAGGGWQDILAAGGSFVSGGYNLALAGINNPLAGRSGWSGNSGGYLTTVVAMPPAAANNSVQLRWILGHDNRIAGNGWFIDDISLTQFTCDASGPELTLTSTDTTASEYLGAADPAEVTVSAVLPLPTSTPVTLAASGTADESLDLSGFTNLTIAAGSTGSSASLLAVSDGIVEGSETLVVTSPDATGSVELTIEDHPYGQWAALTLGTSGAVTPFQDFDGDGSLNIEELVQGTDGTNPQSVPRLDFLPQGGDFKIPVDLGSLPAGILVEGHSSPDLINWSPLGVTVLPDGFLVPGGDPRRFARLIYRIEETAP